ncbi:MAG TPA: response regulator transcription factor [Candidatus Obscuribacterales bacterium]
MAKILLVEDTATLAELICSWLESEQHIVESVDTGSEALSRVRFYPYDIIVIDWGLPDVSGIEVCKTLRKEGKTLPILMLTAKKSIDEKETGFHSGVDDYLTKPFELRELSARIGALLRRQKSIESLILKTGNLELNPQSHKVTRAGQEIHLQPKEFSLLEFFMRHRGQVFSLEAILERLWSADDDASVESVRKHISRLRAKLQDAGDSPALRNVHGVGYKLE